MAFDLGTRLRVNGRFVAGATPAQRFERLIDRRNPDGCWPFLGAINWAGRGLFRGGPGGKLVQASRFAWELTRGPIPEGMSVLHRCDNPRCVNPAHLFLGSQAENVADMLAKGRRVKRGARRA